MKEVARRYIRAPRHYISNPCIRRLHHIGVYEILVHLWRLGLETKEILSRVDYTAMDGIYCKHPWSATETSHVRTVPGDATVMFDDGNTRLRAEKVVRMMMNVVPKIIQGRNLVVDDCAGKLSTYKAFLMVPCHRRFTGCDFETEFIELSMPSLVLIFARQERNPASHIQVADSVQEASKVYINVEDWKMYILRRQQ